MEYICDVFPHFYLNKIISPTHEEHRFVFFNEAEDALNSCMLRLKH